MLPDLPPGWIQVLAAAGAILVVVLILRWTGTILAGHGKLIDTLIGRTYDVIDRIVAGDLRQPDRQTEVTTVDITPAETSPPPPSEP